MKHNFDYETQKKTNYKIKTLTIPVFEPQTRSIVSQRTTNELQRQLISSCELAAKRRNESTYIQIFTYLFLVRPPAMCIATALQKSFYINFD